MECDFKLKIVMWGKEALIRRNGEELLAKSSIPLEVTANISKI